jgi:hypothetical protein
MGLDGGGAGGGGILGVGDSFTGPAEALEIIGNHAYAYSGVKTLGSSFSDMIGFTSGNYYFVGTIGVEGEFDDLGQSQVRIQLNMNDSIVFQTHQAATSDSMVFDTPIPIIIPSYTEVVIAGSQNSGSDIDFEILLVGRIYRA